MFSPLSLHKSDKSCASIEIPNILSIILMYGDITETLSVSETTLSIMLFKSLAIIEKLLLHTQDLQIK